MGLGLVDPTRHTSHATIASIRAGLVPPSGRGFFRKTDIFKNFGRRSERLLELKPESNIALEGLAAWACAAGDRLVVHWQSYRSMADANRVGHRILSDSETRWAPGLQL